ncbi:multiple epidermal growth factor-like domains 10 [Elysia marginata]|uniref:Multiple epidermal growth factor-like domains 10 n=1 Tax=Elysia marginata TaxID=1093978 RepID=A0AAV4J2T2_9GAST|nr:multiple epidermal growth factor-like domains 10 [Elysia marginata]
MHTEDLISEEDRKHGRFYWIGLNQISQEETFKWLDGETESQITKCSDGQPGNNSLSKTCVSIDKRGLWYATDCYQPGNVICERSAECSLTTNGTNCFQIRPSHCGGPNKTCHHSTGECTSGCGVGFQGEHCQFQCSSGIYGPNCSQNCSSDCGGPHKECHHITGECTSGCVAGYKGEKCESQCGSGTFGQNCTQNCSSQCGGPKKECHHITGECTSGCEAGFEGEKCTSPVTRRLDDYAYMPFVVIASLVLVAFLLGLIAFMMFMSTSDHDDVDIKSQKDTTEASPTHFGRDIQVKCDMQDLKDQEREDQEERGAYGVKISEPHDLAEPERHSP